MMNRCTAQDVPGHGGVPGGEAVPQQGEAQEAAVREAGRTVTREAHRGVRPGEAPPEAPQPGAVRAAVLLRGTLREEAADLITAAVRDTAIMARAARDPEPIIRRLPWAAFF